MELAAPRDGRLATQPTATRARPFEIRAMLAARES